MITQRMTGVDSLDAPAGHHLRNANRLCSLTDLLPYKPLTLFAPILEIS